MSFLQGFIDDRVDREDMLPGRDFWEDAAKPGVQVRL
jgi:hypothetical protein